MGLSVCICTRSQRGSTYSVAEVFSGGLWPTHFAAWRFFRRLVS
jgi:hypothetical protein